MPTYLILGPNGVGKSSLVNLLLGERVCATSEFEDCTTEVKKYTRYTAGGELHLIDTPGFGGLDAETDRKRLQMTRDFTAAHPFDVMLLVARSDDRRLRPFEMSGIKMISDIFGREVLKQCWLTLTFCGSLPRANFASFILSRQTQLGEQVKKHSPEFADFERTILVDASERSWAPAARHPLRLLG